MGAAPSRLRLGTRASPLARVQAEGVRAALAARHPGLTVELVFVRTTGDRVTGPLAAAGGKGLFVKEIEEALLDGRIDAGVHSMKDVPARLAAGLVIGAVPERADARDVLIGGDGGLAGLPPGARIGTASPRRRAQLLAHRPDLVVVLLRGNVDTRLRKWRAGEVVADGVFERPGGLAEEQRRHVAGVQDGDGVRVRVEDGGGEGHESVHVAAVEQLGEGTDDSP